MTLPRPLLLVALCLLAADTASARQDAPRRPNIIVIVGDDMGYADIGVHGSRDIPTPHIDSLAAGGVRCTHGYVSGPYCSPTRAGLLTGRYQQRFGHEFNPGGARDAAQRDRVGLSTEETTLAERLRAAGYQTALVGKWHLGEAERFRPQNRGFDEFVGFLGGAHAYFPATRPAAAPVYDGEKPYNDFAYLTDLFARRAAEFVLRDRDKPFFLYLAFNAVHTPMHATDAKLKQFAHITDPRRRQYAAMMSSMDDAIGTVLDALRRRGIENDTLIFFISDNGGPERANASDNGPLRGGKATTWEGGIRVPFLAQWKGHLPAGAVYENPVIQLDIAPTCLAAAGVDLKDAKMDGVNLLDAFSGRSSMVPHETLYWRFGGQMAIRQGDWKLVIARDVGRNPGRQVPDDLAGAMLFNLRDDPGETRDLSKENPNVVARLARAWRDWNAGLVDPAWPAPQERRRR